MDDAFWFSSHSVMNISPGSLLTYTSARHGSACFHLLVWFSIFLFCKKCILEFLGIKLLAFCLDAPQEKSRLDIFVTSQMLTHFNKKQAWHICDITNVSPLPERTALLIIHSRKNLSCSGADGETGFWGVRVTQGSSNLDLPPFEIVTATNGRQTNGRGWMTLKTPAGREDAGASGVKTVYVICICKQPLFSVLLQFWLNTLMIAFI